MFLRRFRKFTKRLNGLVKRMVGVAGFEPATPTSRTWCATRLRYTPTEGRSYNPGTPKGKLENGNDCPARNTCFKGRSGCDRGSRALPRGGRACRIPDRNRLRAWRRRRQWRSGGPALCGQGAPVFQSADRPRRGCRCRPPRRCVYSRCGKTRGGILAGPADARVGKAAACGVADLALAGLDTVAVRLPAHSVPSALLKEFGRPVVAPSANRSGHVSPTSAAHVLADLRGRIDLVIDAGPCEVGVESTIVSCADEPSLLRPGGIAREAIEGILGYCVGDCCSHRRSARGARDALVTLCTESHAAPGRGCCPPR